MLGLHVTTKFKRLWGNTYCCKNIFRPSTIFYCLIFTNWRISCFSSLSRIWVRKPKKVPNSDRGLTKDAVLVVSPSSCMPGSLNGEPSSLGSWACFFGSLVDFFLNGVVVSFRGSLFGHFLQVFVCALLVWLCQRIHIDTMGWSQRKITRLHRETFWPTKYLQEYEPLVAVYVVYFVLHISECFPMQHHLS